MTNRRELLSGAAAVTALSAAPGLGLSEPAQAANATAKLGPWAYGRGSFADDTVLMFRGNPAHTFYGTGPVADELRPYWKFRTRDLKSTLRGNPITWTGTGWTGTASKLGDYVYVGSAGGELYCLHAMSGKLIWRYRTSSTRMFKGSLCIYNNRIYIGNVDNKLHCVDAATGKQVWTHDTFRDLDSSPCVVDGRLYIAGENGNARCVDPETGKLIWKTFLGGIGPGTKPGSNGSETSPAVADGEYYAATYDGDLFCLYTKDGSIKWKAKTHDDTDASPVVSGDFVYAASEERVSHLYCFERDKGAEVWRYSANKRGYWSTPAVVGNRIYVGGDDGRMHCVDAATGKSVWQYRTRAAIWSSPCVLEGKVIFGGRDFHLYMLDAASGKEIWKYKCDGRIISSPCIVDGHVWIGTATGWFYCFGP